MADTLTPKLDKAKKITISGHSLGGGIGLLLAGILQDKGFKVNVFTFGMQPVGNQVFVDHLRHLSHQRYVHFLDVIPRLNATNIAQVQTMLNSLEKNIDKENNVLFYEVLRYLKHIPNDFVQHGKANMLYTFDLPKQDILPQAWMMPAYYHLAVNYANILAN